MSQMQSAFKNKILVPTLFAHSTDMYKYVPAETLTLMDKVTEKKKKQLYNTLLAILQKKDDTKKQSLVTSLPIAPRFSSGTSRQLIRSTPKSPSTAQITRKPTPADNNWIQDIPYASLQLLIEMQEVDKSKLLDLKERLSRRSIVVRSVEEKKDQEMRDKFSEYQQQIDKNFYISRLDNLRAEDQKAEKAREFREFIENSHKAQAGDLKSKHKREEKSQQLRRASQEIKRSKCVSKIMQPFLQQIEQFNKESHTFNRKFGKSLKQLQKVQQSFRLKPVTAEAKTIIDFMHQYRERQIQENRSKLPLVV